MQEVLISKNRVFFDTKNGLNEESFRDEERKEEVKEFRKLFLKDK